jgi:CRP-like cAMP-binding protein
MATCESALVRKLTRFGLLGVSELAALATLEARPRRIAAGTELVYEHQASHHAYILQEGWACAYKLLEGGGRQVIDFSIPGDILGLRSVLLRTSDHSFAAVTNVVVAEVIGKQLIDNLVRLPKLGAAILWAASRDEAMVVEHLVSVGRRGALERIVHLLLELGFRLHLAGLASENSYACPLNQYLLADAVGLTAIHVNRILRQLREQNLLTFRAGQVVFHDINGLRRVAGWDSGYLDETPRPN